MKGNKIILLVSKVDDFTPIAIAYRGIKNTTTKVDLNNPEHHYFPDTDRFWVYIKTGILGYKSKYDTVITLAVAGKTYDAAYHGWLQLMEHIE